MRSLITTFYKAVILFGLYLSLTVQGLGSPSERLLAANFTERIEMMNQLVDSLNRQVSRASVFRELKRNEIWAHENGDTELEYLFHLFQLKQEISLLPDDRMRAAWNDKRLVAFIDKLEMPKFLHVKLHAMSVLADFYWSFRRDQKSAFEVELRNFDLYKDIPASKHPLKNQYLFQFASRHYGFRDYANAKRLLLTIPEIERDDKYPGVHLYYNLLGLCYRNMGVYDSAAHYFGIGYQKIAPQSDSMYMAIIAGNTGITYYYQKRFDEAIPLLENDIRYCLAKNRATDNATKSLCILGDTYLQKGNVAKAAQLLETAYNIVRREGYWEKYELLEFVYSISAKIFAKQGNSAKAYAFLDSATIARDSINVQRSALILAGAQNHVAAQLHLAQIQKLQSQKTQQVIIRNSLICGVLLLGGLALLFINRQKIQNRRRQERLESEKELYAAELSNAGAQLEMFTKSIHEKNALIEEFSAQLESLQPGTPMETSYEIETLTKLKESTILTDSEWENFRKLFEKVHGGFLEKLRIKIPALSPAETRFLALTKLRLTNKEMAGTLGISTDAVRMNKHRLRKKLNLEEDTTIDELVGSL